MNLEGLQLELDRVGNLIDGAGATFEILREQLKPYWYARGEIEHAINRTHGRRSDGALIFNWHRRGDRVPLFAQLDELTREWGPVKTDYAMVKARLSGYERDRRKLVNEIKYLKRREAKNDKGQGSLF